MKILRITFSNLRKRKGAAISLGVLIILASLLLNVGLNLILNAKNIVLERIEAMNGPHFSIILGSNLYMPEYQTFFEEDARVVETEIEPVIAMDNAKTQFGSGEMELGALFQNVETDRSMLPFQPLEEMKNPPEDAIYIPIGMKDGSPAVGEKFPLIYKNKTYTFTVAGYFETPVHGTANTGIVRYYLCDSAYQKLCDEIGIFKMISARLEDPEKADDLKLDFKKFTKGEISGNTLATVTQISYHDMQYVGTIMPNMFSAGLIGFAMILFVVVALVVKFRISANIEDNVHNIGVLGAIGYTSNQIMFAMLMKFVILALIGGILGVLLAGAIMPILGKMLVSVSGVIWKGKIALIPNLLSVVFLILLVVTIVIIGALRIRRLPPVIALRGGLMTHTFRKNQFALHRSGNVNLQLAGKFAISNPKQNVLLGIVMAGVAFIMILAMLLYTNIVQDQTSLIRMCGVELSDVVVHLTNHTDAENLEQQLSVKEGVRKLSMADIIMAEVEEEEVMTEISKDFSKMETMNVYEGSFPRYENETVITGMMADRMGKTIGDTIHIKYGGVTAEYLITGLTQSTNMGGKLCFLSLDGFRRLDPYYMQSSISVYLKEGKDVEEFLKELEQEFHIKISGNYKEVEESIREKMENLMTMYGTDSLQYALMEDGNIILSGSSEQYQVERLENYQLKIQAQLYSMSAMFTSLTQVISLFSIFVIGLILNMLMKTILRKWKREFGILKALGYTSGQLSIQIVGSVFPSAFLGTFIGGVMGSVFAKSVFTKMFYNTGITNMILVINIWTMIFICGLILLAVLLCAFAFAQRVRRISVYGLMTE